MSLIIGLAIIGFFVPFLAGAFFTAISKNGKCNIPLTWNAAYVIAFALIGAHIAYGV